MGGNNCHYLGRNSQAVSLCYSQQRAPNNSDSNCSQHCSSTQAGERPMLTSFGFTNSSVNNSVPVKAKRLQIHFRCGSVSQRREKWLQKLFAVYLPKQRLQDQTRISAPLQQNCPQGVRAVVELVLQHIAPQSSHHWRNLEQFLNPISTVLKASENY